MSSYSLVPRPILSPVLDHGAPIGIGVRHVEVIVLQRSGTSPAA